MRGTVATEGDTTPASGEGHQGLITDFIASSGGQSLASASDDGTIILWDLQRRTIVHQWVAHGGPFHIAVSPTDGRIISAGATKLKFWDVSNGETPLAPLAEYVLEHGWLEDCFWSSDGEWIAFSEMHGTTEPHEGDFVIHLWNAHTMSEHRVFSPKTGSIHSPSGLMGFSPDSRCLAWVMWYEGDPYYSVWSVGTDPDKPLSRVPAKPDSALGHFRSVSFDPHSKRTVTTHSDLPSGGKDLNMRVWDNDIGELLVVMEGHTDQVTDAGFSPDGARILSVSLDGKVKVWDAEGGVCLLSLDGHEMGLTKAIYSPDGCYIATASDDKNVQLWKGEDGMCLATFAEHTIRVTDLVFSPDGQTLASGDENGIVHIRDISGVVQH